MIPGADSAGLRAAGGRRRDFVAPAVATAALGMAVIGLAVSDHGIELAPGLPTWLAIAGFLGLTAMVVAAWVVLPDRSEVATGLSVAILGLSLPSWTVGNWMPPDTMPLMHAAAPMAVAGATHAGVSWTPGTKPPRALISVYALALLAAALIAVGYDPLADPACAFTCADANPVAGSVVTTRAAVVATAALITAATVIAGWAMTVARGGPRVLRLCAFISLGLLVASWGVRAAWWADPVPPVVAVATQVVAAWVLAAGALNAWWMVRQSRFAAGRLVAELNEAQATGGKMLGGRAVEFAIPGEDRWVDADGQTVPRDGARDGAVALHFRGEPAVRVRAGAGATAPPLDDISPSARVALDIARLTAVTKARVTDVQESRRRIIRASDAERLRIARDVHDGAQQRLISASLHISLAASRIPAQVAERAQTAIGDALEQLRRLAHGLVPETLGSEGIRTALDDLVRESGVRAVLEMADVTVDDDVASAIHAAVTAVVAHARAAEARGMRVDVAQELGDRISLRIEVKGPSRLDAWDEIPIVDRIGAVGGTTAVHAVPTRLLVRAELPCVS